jgi:stage V sporulation protein T
VDKLDELLKIYIQKIKENSAAMLDRLNDDLCRETEDIQETEQSAANLEAVLADLQEELKATKRQRIRDIMKHPEQEAVLEETYDALESDLVRRMEGLQNQIQMTADKRNTIIQVNRVAKAAMEVFDDILNKEKLDRNDLELIIQKIKVYEDHIEIQLKADVDSILRCGTIQDVEAAVAAVSMEGGANFPDGTENIEPVTIVQSGSRRPDKVFRANVISDGDPLEIYTSRDGEVIFKKYSLLGGVEDFASQLCETMSRSTGTVCAVTDRDTVIAVAGGGKRELMGKRITAELEQIMESRRIYQYGGEGTALAVSDSTEKLVTLVAAPILSEGDVLGLVLVIGSAPGASAGDAEFKLAQTIAAFLGRHMEN